MNIYILRHGLAGTPGPHRGPNDSKRPLTAKGKDKVRKIAKAMKAMDLRFDQILSSPYARARQTAEIAAKVLKMRKRLEFSEHLTPDGSARELIQFLTAEKRRLEDVLLVGHEPYLSELTTRLLTGGGPTVVVLKKGGLCKLEVESLKLGRCAKLDWLLTPKQMVLMA